MMVLFPLIGFWFWAVLIASAGWLLAAVYNDRYVQATVDIVLLIAILGVTGNIDLPEAWRYILHHPISILGSAMTYLVAGLAWSTLRWRLLLRRFKALLAEYWKDTERTKEDLPYEFKMKGLRMVEGKVRLEVDHFKSKIIGWMVYWPPSILVWLVGDALHELFETVYLNVRRFYQRMADSVLNE